MMGRVDVDRMLAEMSSAEFYEWALYLKSEPDAETRADARHGILAYLIARTMGGVKNAKPTDYIPKFETVADKPQSMEDAIRVAIKTTIMLGGTVT